jgi:hypothetical protein
VACMTAIGIFCFLLARRPVLPGMEALIEGGGAPGA